MIVVMHIRANFYTTRQNTIQYDQTLMVPALICEDISPRLKKTHSARLLASYAPVGSQLQVTGCCPTGVDAIPLVVNLKSLSIEVICIKAY
jgi:hypothetical protein